MNRLARVPAWLGALLAALLLAAPAVAENPNHNLTVSVDPSGHVETGWRFELPTGLTVHGEVGFLNGGECSTDGTEIDCDDLPDNTVQNIATASAAVGYTRTVGTVDLTFAGNVDVCKGSREQRQPLLARCRSGGSARQLRGVPGVEPRGERVRDPRPIRPR